jgi:hypothetical protein
MARSQYIYLVKRDSDVLAAFTVKYEMENWIGRYPGDYSLVRLRDGCSSSDYEQKLWPPRFLASVRQEGQD